jgi:hypothetical protein
MIAERLIMEKKLLTARLAVSEIEALKALAQSDGVTVTGYLQNLVSEKPVQRKKPRAVKPTLNFDPDVGRQLAAIGNNLNQLARRAHIASLEGHFEAIEVLAAIEQVNDKIEQLYQAAKECRDAH